MNEMVHLRYREAVALTHSGRGTIGAIWRCEYTGQQQHE